MVGKLFVGKERINEGKIVTVANSPSDGRVILFYWFGERVKHCQALGKIPTRVSVKLYSTPANLVEFINKCSISIVPNIIPSAIVKYVKINKLLTLLTYFSASDIYLKNTLDLPEKIKDIYLEKWIFIYLH